jgi:hypothetical protein
MVSLYRVACTRVRLLVLLRFAVVPAALAAVTAVACLVACLPDLVLPAAEDAGPPSLCGDGIIEPDAGEQCDPGSGEGGTTTACRECRVACVVGSDSTTIDPTTNHCYFEPGSTVQETDAVSACEVAGGHVVRFVSANELAFVTNWAATRPFWVGIVSQTGGWFPNESTPEPGWTPDCQGCFAGGSDGGDIAKGTSAADTGRCVSGGQGTWSESICSSTVKGFSLWTVCEREALGTRATRCGNNTCLTVTATQDAKSYVLMPTPLVANDATLACSSLGGRLAIFGSAEEREQVAYEIASQRTLPQIGLWIGLSTDALGAWAWDVADAGMTPLPWGFDQPGGVAVVGRAFSLVAQGQSAPDSELARVGNATDAGAETHIPLCEIP